MDFFGRDSSRGSHALICGAFGCFKAVSAPGLPPPGIRICALCLWALIGEGQWNTLLMGIKRFVYGQKVFSFCRRMVQLGVFPLTFTGAVLGLVWITQECVCHVELPTVSMLGLQTWFALNPGSITHKLWDSQASVLTSLCLSLFWWCQYFAGYLWRLNGDGLQNP